MLIKELLFVILLKLTFIQNITIKVFILLCKCGEGFCSSTLYYFLCNCLFFRMIFRFCNQVKLQSWLRYFQSKAEVILFSAEQFSIF